MSYTPIKLLLKSYNKKEKVTKQDVAITTVTTVTTGLMLYAYAIFKIADKI